MIKKELYSGNGVSLSPIKEEGRSLSNYVRLIADDGFAITNGTVTTTCVDVLSDETEAWTDCELPPVEEEIEF